MNKQKYLIAANWKQNGDVKSATKLINDIVKLYKKNQPKCDVLILPPAIYLSTILSRINYYKDHEWIVNEKLPIKVDNTTKISFDSLYYDEGKNIITVTPYKRNELLNSLK